MQPKINFKLRLVRKPRNPKGIYEQLGEVSYVPYDKGKFSLDEMKKAFAELYANKQQGQRRTKIVTNQAGYELFQKALEKEFKKQKHDRKRLSIKSKVFK